jgi:hypothetical protein
MRTVQPEFFRTACTILTKVFESLIFLPDPSVNVALDRLQGITVNRDDFSTSDAKSVREDPVMEEAWLVDAEARAEENADAIVFLFGRSSLSQLAFDNLKPPEILAADFTPAFQSSFDFVAKIHDPY